MKIAVITSGNPDNMKGVMNYVQEKLHRLQRINENFSFDFYMIRHRDSFLFSIIRRKRRSRKINKVIINDVVYNNLWVEHGFFDYLWTLRLKRKTIILLVFMYYMRCLFCKDHICLQHGCI